MYGFQAISDANGWSMAFAGILIVFTGLTVLATVISQLHKVLGFIEQAPARIKNKSKPARIKAEPDKIKSKEEEMILAYANLSQELKEPFDLRELYSLARKKDFLHPHIALSQLRYKGILISGENGLFSFNSTIKNKEV